MDSNHHRVRRFPRPRLGSRGRAQTASNLVELETLSAFSALERRAVALSEDEAQVCSRLAELLLADALKAYDGHVQTGRDEILRGQPQVDLQQWKLLKKKDQLCAYKQRKDVAKVVANGLQLGPSMANETELPLLMVTGYLAGHVNDAMYGLASANTRAMKLNSVYAEDSLEDAEVLATIEGPTIEEPFRFLGLKWAVRRDGMSGSSFVKRRDLLYLEATGVTKLANGDRVGYRVIHSVSVKALAQLATTSFSSSVIRARASIVQLFHEQPSSEGSGGLTGTLNVFTRGYYDPQGGMMQFMAVNAGAELLLHMTFSVVDCAHLKKIAFAAQQAGRRRRATSQLHKTTYGYGGMGGIEEVGDEDTDMAMGNGGWSTSCSLCDRRVGSLLNRTGAPCAICAKMVCSRCSVVKKLRFSRSDDDNVPMNGGVDLGGSMGVHDFEQPEASHATTERSRSRSSSGSGAASMTDIIQKALKFCLPCVLRANQRNASQIVVEEILEQTSFGLVTPSKTMDRPSSRTRPSSMRRRSTQTGRPYNLRSSQATYGSQQFSHYAASPYYQPRQKAYSSAAYVPRPSSATPRVMLYVEDPAASLSGYSAA